MPLPKNKGPGKPDPFVSIGDLQSESVLRRVYRNANRNGTRTFLASPHLVLDHLAFVQFLNGDTLKFRVMEEQIVTVTGDETHEEVS